MILYILLWFSVIVFDFQMEIMKLIIWLFRNTETLGKKTTHF